MVAKSSWHTSKWAIITLHALVWITWFTFPYLMRMNAGPIQIARTMPATSIFRATDSSRSIAAVPAMPEPSFRPMGRPQETRFFVKIRTIENVYLLLVFYLNAYWLVPKLLYRKRVWQYVGILLLLLVILATGTHLLFYISFNDGMPFFGPRLLFSFSSYLFFFFIALSITYRIVSDKTRNDKLQQEKVNANLKTELLFLRSQISPHFMFNVLNNMVSLARKHSDQLEPSLIKLSGLMRYMLYEADTDKVPLEKETEYLRAYVELQQQRFAESVQVRLHIDGDENGYYIEPMLLIPFVENAFKHGMGLVSDPRIIISLQIKNGTLLMEVRNRFNKISGEIKDKTSGIGLSNVKRRLDLLYQENHSLLISSQDEWFTVLLQLKLT